MFDLNELFHTYQQDVAFEVDIAGQKADLFRVVKFNIVENISQLFHAKVVLASRDKSIDIDDCIEMMATLTLHNKFEKQPRYFHGVIESMSQSDSSGHWGMYHISIMPAVHRLRHGSDSRIHQFITVPDIIKELLWDHGIHPIEFRLKDSPMEREFCVQYRETHWAFVERLLSEEGIYYYFEHTKNDHKLIFTDVVQQTTELESPNIKYNARSGGNVKGAFIQNFHWRKKVRPTEVTQRDYCFKKPYYDQEHIKQAADPHEYKSYKIYNSYGRYKEKETGQRFTDYQLEALRSNSSMGGGASNVMHFSAGHRFVLTDHDNSKLNNIYMLVGVIQQGSQPQALEEEAGSLPTEYSNQFTVFEEGTQPWRPARIQKPIIHGSQIAHVVGPAGEEIYTDNYGRVKLHFPWDRLSKKNDTSSCWIRVSQAWAGRGYGMVAIPRIGHEVIVDFLEGDPDQPIVIGRTYHDGNPHPYGLPANKTQTGILTRSSKGGGASNANQLRFEDKKGQEQVYIHAEKNQDNVVELDETTFVGRDRTENIGRDEKITIGRDRTENVGHDEKITIGNDRTEQVGVNEKVKIGSNRSVNIGSNKSETIGKNKTETIAIAKALSIGAAYQVSVGAGMNTTVGLIQASEIGINKLTGVGKKYALTAGKEIVLQTGASSLTMKSDGTIVLKGVDISVIGDGEITVKAAKNIVMKGKNILEN